MSCFLEQYITMYQDKKTEENILMITVTGQLFEDMYCHAQEIILKCFNEWRFCLRSDNIDDDTIKEFKRLKELKDPPEIENIKLQRKDSTGEDDTDQDM